MDAPRDVVRPATAGDAEALARLATQLGYPATSGDLRARLARLAPLAGHAVLVAERAGAVTGWVHVAEEFHLESGSFAEVAGLVVDEGARGAGTGSALLAAAEAWAGTRGLGTLRVRSNVLRNEAHAFYRKRGYAERKEQKVFEKRLP